MGLSEILKMKRKELGYTLLDIAIKMGVSEATVQRWESGNIKNLRHERISRLAEILEVTPAFLMGWSEEPTPTNYSHFECSDDEIYKAGGISVAALPLVAILGSVRAGYGGVAYEEIIGYETADVKNPEECFYLVVRGDSMEPDIHDGDLALVRKQSDVDSGNLAVVIINGDEGTLKRVIKAKDSLILQPFNPSYETTVITGEMLNDVRIAGKVLYTTSKKQW